MLFSRIINQKELILLNFVEKSLITLPILVKEDNYAQIQMILYHSIIVFGVKKSHVRVV